jgi:hypothetical protein
MTARSERRTVWIERSGVCPVCRLRVPVTRAIRTAKHWPRQPLRVDPEQLRSLARREQVACAWSGREALLAIERKEELWGA